jgi:tetratricopeptide (TPR) repeat protein
VEPAKYAMVWDTLGTVRTAEGQHAEAIACFEESLRIERASQDRWREVITLTNLSRCLRDAGRDAEARAAWRRALDRLDETDAVEGLNVSRSELVDLLASVPDGVAAT